MKQELVDQWVAVQVRSRSEHMVETLLQHKGYRTWSPYLPKLRAGGRSSRPDPLFPGYVFCQLREASHGLVVTTPGVLRFVGPGGRPSVVPPAEIAAIQTVLTSGLPARPTAMQPGCNVEVVAGPLKGCCGTILEWKQRDLLLVGVSLLQRAVGVVVEKGWLRPILHKPILAATRGSVERAIQQATVGAQVPLRVRPEWRIGSQRA